MNARVAWRGWAVSAGALMALAGAFFFMPGESLQAYPLEQASVEVHGSETLLTLATTGKSGQLPHEVFCLDEPFRVVVDVFGADTPAAVEAHPGGMVSEIRSSVWKDDPAGRIVRYVIETNEPVDYTTTTTSGTLQVSLRSATDGSDSPVPSHDPVEYPPAEAMDQAAHESTDEAESATDSASDSHSGSDFDSASDSDASSSDASILQAEVEAVVEAEAVPTLAESPTMTEDFVATPTTVQEFLKGNWDDSADELREQAGSYPAAYASHEHGLPPGLPGNWAAGQDAAPQLPHSPGLSASLSAPDDVVTGGDTRAMNLDVQNADVRTVFRSIAEFGGINVVADRDVSGPVTIRLAEVPWRRALDIVCQSAGMIAVEENGVLRVATERTFASEELERESNARKREQYLPLETHVFYVSYAFAAELSASVALILSDRGTVNFDGRTNSLIVSDISSRIDECARLIGSLDTKTQQVEITAHLVSMDAQEVTRLGIDWNLSNVGSTSDGTSLGAGVSEPLLDASGAVQFGLVQGWGNLDATLEAFEQENVANIISKPKITTINNSPARILIGKEVPLITLDQAGNAVTELKKVGITLRVTPFINAEGNITMALHPEVSDLSSQATVQGGLIFTTAEAETRVMVKSGQTAVIGGLIKTNETEFEQGVPILRSIPFLGGLFRTSDSRTEKQELLVFVTPRIVEDMAQR